jgi:flagellin
MIINHNISSLNTYRQMSANGAAQAKNMERLSSGLRINKASDDAAGLAISEKMRGQIRGLEMASKNAQDGISFLQTAEGALNETHSILQRMRELSVQSANDTNTDSDRSKLQNEMDQLAEEITRISNSTEFNGQNLINGGIQSGNVGQATFQIGSNAGQSISFSIGAMDAQSLGVARDVATASVSGATDVTSAKLSGNLGDAVVDGTSITLSAAVATAGTTATAGTIGGITFTTADNSDTLNGYTITVNNGGTANSETATVDTTNKTISLTISDSGTLSTSTQINTALNNALSAAGITDVQFAATGTVTSGGGTGSGTLTGGAQDTIALTATAGSVTETINVLGNATSATFTDSTKFKGLNVSLDGNLSSGTAGSTATTAAATLTISKVSSTAASFSGGALSNKATVAGGIDISTKTAASDAITAIDTAIESVSSERSKMGAIQNRLDHTINNLGTTAENLTAAESRIRDVDMAKEMMEQTKNSILSQAAQAMLAQANQAPQGVLQLLR